MAIEIEIHVGDAGRHPALAGGGLVDLLTRAVQVTLAVHGVGTAEMSVTLLDDEAIAAMNRRYLDHEGPTDVISFGLTGEGGTTVGDIYIGWEQALRQAAEFAVSPREELARLAVHGTLHVIGYDHPEGEEREQSEMWEQQEAIVREVVES